jgi:hypothetical protein
MLVRIHAACSFLKRTKINILDFFIENVFMMGVAGSWRSMEEIQDKLYTKRPGTPQTQY